MTVSRELKSEIQEFYEDKTVFITGGTGFLGKLLIEKLLRTTNVRRIYLLLRGKKGKRPDERLGELFDIPAFETLHHQKPHYRDLISILEGDLALPDLGLKQKEKEVLLGEVNIIVHSGATVRFDEELKKAAYINVRSTRDLLRIGTESKKLESFVYISTAYSNCLSRTIEEKYYEPIITGENLLKLVDAIDVEMLGDITPKLLKGNPNTYVFTKCIAEEQVKQFSKLLPVAIVRPSIVISSYKEPIPGWLDNLYGPTSILLGAAFGLIRALNCDKNTPADLVPVDYVINSVIASGWDVAQTGNNKIFNYVSSPQNLLTWETYETLTRKYGLQVPSPLVIWHSTFFLIRNRLLWLIYTFFVQTIPAYVIDFMAKLVGKKPMLVKAYKKIYKFCDAITYFCTNSWTFSNDNTVSLWNKLNSKDKEIYPFDIAQMSWEDFFTTYLVGARVYLLKDPLETLPQGRRKLKILKLAHYTLLTIFAIIAFKLCGILYDYLR